MNLNQIPFFLPTMYGDIRLTAQSNQTEVEWENLSPSEREAMTALGRKFDVDTSGSTGKIVIPKTVEKVEAFLAKSMKRGRKLLSAVVFKNGRIEEIHRLPTGEMATTAAAPIERVEDKPKAAVTVAQPTVGCPIPEFERANVRATRVLREFMSPQQLSDFERTQSFLVLGADSGHKYILTSRQAPIAQLARVGGRSVFDVNLGHDICVHDWVVPAAEELLELKLFLELPGLETYVTGLRPGVH